ncbi:MAG: hypothetical protein AABZ31_01575 [Bdellovibrionota bacterium]
MQEIENENLSRPKTQQRIRQEAQLEVLRKKHGSLEDIRRELGFSQKQMGELLLVDASAWSRWIKPGEDAPAHIYQALDWYLEARDIRSVFKSELTQFDFIEKSSGASVPAAALAPQSQIDSSALNEAVSGVAEKMALWEIEKNQLAEKLKKSEALQAGWKLFLILNSFILFYLIVNRYFSF